MDITIENSLMDSKGLESKVKTEYERIKQKRDKKNEVMTETLVKWVREQAETYGVSPYDVVRIYSSFVNENGDILIRKRYSRVIYINNKQLNLKGSYHDSLLYWYQNTGLSITLFPIVFTLAWRRSSMTDKNDTEYLKNFERLPFHRFERITTTKDEEKRALKAKYCDYVDAKVNLSTSSLGNDNQSTSPLENEDRELKDKVAELNKRLAEYDEKIAELNAELERKNLAQNSCVVEEISAHGAHLQTGEVLHLVEHSGIRKGSESSNQEWAVVLSLLTGCSVNTLRQKMSTPDLSPASRAKVEKLYNEALEELKKKNKGSV